MKLNDRMKTIADCVDQGATVADIGTDHAFIPAYLVENGISDWIIASDISQGPIDNALKTIEGLGIGDKVSTVLAPGLKGIYEPVDNIIIAGMGGIVIAEIIEESYEIACKAKKLILQPMSSTIDLRKYLYERSFTIIEEKIAVEGEKFYEIIIAVPKQAELIDDELYFEISHALRQNRDQKTRLFLQRKIKVSERILNQILQNSGQYTDEGIGRLRRKLEKLREVLVNADKF